ncbi:phosphate permease [Prolixibacteraceae bacterium JC049]|nr:phosphate permease [Prolixibacteraceae bacterium JC049]
MESFYLILVVVLFALAISDLIVGVSNDAVNFLNSAIGSKAAPKWLIFLVASLGVLVGATFSSGMMEVARKGIFHPDMFYFSEIMTIFLAVMITDVILLDMFNTLGLPTSTTVSIVFELLGSAVAVSIIKIKSMSGEMSELAQYINSDKALAIISGILLSVIIAFAVGAAVQYISRLVFTFQYDKKLKYYGSIFGGLAIAAITYFILIKGMKGSSFAAIEVADGVTIKKWVGDNTIKLIFFSFLGWTLVMEVLKSLFKVNILKLIVLVGTFALAMAFAGNDLVNFIGVPLAGFKSFQAWAASGVGPDAFSMAMLKGKVGTPTYMLLISGLVMIITLIASRKARSVVATTINLSRQDEGDERFGSNFISRLLVRNTMSFNKRLRKVMPAVVVSGIERRFEPVQLTQEQEEDEDRPAFDLIRAACNLVVASILISIGTSLKLPLSTTYVTFMVAMGTSLADRAWDRESAVYRISGVFTVVGGWFMTAFVAFSVAAIVASAIALGGKFMVFVFVGIAIFMVIRTHIIFKKKENGAEEDDEFTEPNINTQKVLERSQRHSISGFIYASKAFELALNGFFAEDRSTIKEALAEIDEFNVKSKKHKNNIYKAIQRLQADSVETGHYYVQVHDYLRELSHSISYTVRPIYHHVDNNHKPLAEAQIEELKGFATDLSAFFNEGLHMLKEEKFEACQELINKQAGLLEKLDTMERAQIKRIKKKEVNTRNSILYFNLISETKNVLLNAINLAKSQRDFVQHTTEES